MISPDIDAQAAELQEAATWYIGSRVGPLLSRAADALIRLDAERQAAREALAFYATPEVYKPHPHGLAFDDRDLSFRARAALAAAPSPADGGEK